MVSEAARIPAHPIPADAREVAIDRGVKFLVSRLSPSHAIISSDGGAQYSTAITALALLSLSAAGHDVGDRSAEAFALRMGQDFLLRSDRIGADGYYGRVDQSTIVGHGIVTTALGELIMQNRIWDQRKLAERRFAAACRYTVRYPLRVARKSAGDTYNGSLHCRRNTTRHEHWPWTWNLPSLWYGAQLGQPGAREAFRATANWRSYYASETARIAVGDRVRSWIDQLGKTFHYPQLLLAVRLGAEVKPAQIEFCRSQVVGHYAGLPPQQLLQRLASINGGPEVRRRGLGPRTYWRFRYYALLTTVWAFSGETVAGGGVGDAVEIALLADQRGDGGWLAEVESIGGAAYATAMATLTLSTRDRPLAFLWTEGLRPEEGLSTTFTEMSALERLLSEGVK